MGDTTNETNPTAEQLEARARWEPLLWQSSLTRTMFWYFFGYGFLVASVFAASMVYGRPIISPQDGFLRLTHLSHWSGVQGSMVFASIGMMSIYFLPLAYM